MILRHYWRAVRGRLELTLVSLVASCYWLRPVKVIVFVNVHCRRVLLASVATSSVYTEPLTLTLTLTKNAT